MKKKSSHGLVLVITLLAVLLTSTQVRKVTAPTPVIYIKADGSIEPPTANITSFDNVTYTFTADINASIIVQRSNVVIDGDEWTLDGLDFAIWEGFNLTSVSNVTIVNVNIERFVSYSILLKSASQCVISMNTVSGSEGGIVLFSSRGNTVSNNLITGCSEAVELASSAENSLLGNNMSASSSGFLLFNSTANLISGNNVTDNDHGIALNTFSNDNIISGNNISRSAYGVQLYSCSYNTIIGNTVSNNTEGIFLYNSSHNTIAGNFASNNRGDGIFLTFSHNNTITGNNVSNNPSLGIQLYSCSHNTITDNIASNNEADGIFLFSSSNNTISGNNITSNVDTGINLDSSSDSTISENLIDGNLDGIHLSYSSNITISGNNITGNNQGIFLQSSDENAIFGNDFYSNPSAGIRLYSSSNNTIQKNTNFSGYGIQYGIELWVYSHNNIVSENKLSSLYRGIALGHSDGNRILNNIVSKSEIVGIDIQQICNNSIIANNVISNSSQYGISIWPDDVTTRNNVIQDNTLTHNLIGIYIVRLSGNVIYHNNFIDNTQQTSISNSANTWDDGVEGNYWSNYTGVDANHDGIGDTPHVINENNTDAYPLMGVFHSFNTSAGDYVDVMSNSTVDGFRYFASNTTIRLHVTNTTTSQTHGFCRIRIPYDVMLPPFTVTVDGANPTYWNYALHDDGASRWIYFEYEHSTKDVIVIPEFPSTIILPLLLALSLLVTIVYRRRHAFKT